MLGGMEAVESGASRPHYSPQTGLRCAARPAPRTAGAAVAGAIGPLADGMRRAGSGWIGEMHRLPHLDGDARRAKVCRDHTHLIRAGRPLATGGKGEQQHKGQERKSAAHACLHGGMSFRVGATTDVMYMNCTLWQAMGSAACAPGARCPATAPR